jgi:hypothetical protein
VAALPEHAGTEPGTEVIDVDVEPAGSEAGSEAAG